MGATIHGLTSRGSTRQSRSTIGGAIAALAMMLAGCSTNLLPWQQNQVAVSPANTARSFSYQCSNNQTFEVTFLPERALLRLPNQPEIILTQVENNATTYSSGDVIFNATQNNAFVEINGQRTYQSCTTNAADSSDTSSSAAPSAQTSPDQTNQGSQTNQTAISCRSTNYFADLTWVQGQPLMSFGDGRNPNLASNTPVTVSQTADGGTIYTTRTANAARMVVYPNGSCALQVISSNGTTTVNELGQVSTGNVQNSQTYQDGFDRGYRIGVQSGRTYRIYNYGYDPNRAFAQVTPSQDASYNEGFRRGFYAGFDAGYSSVSGSNPGGSSPINGLW
jgi:hypothetical protein